MASSSKGLGKRLTGFWKKHPVWSLVLAAGVLLVALGGVRSLRGPEVPVLVVKRGPLVHRVVMSGRVSPPAGWVVASQLSGTVARVLVDEGTRVQPGQVLVEQDAAPQEADVARARAALEQARARLGNLKEVGVPQREEAVRRAEAELARVEREAQRAKALAEAGVMTRVQLEEAVTALEVARSRLASARAEAAGSGQGGSEQRQAEAALAEAELRAAEARRAQATLTATTPAVVLTREVDPGDSVQPGTKLLTLARLGGTQLTVEGGMGAGLARFFASLATNPDGSPTFPVQLDAKLFLTASAVAIVTGLLSAVIPARRASGLDPAVVIREA
ncbi:biotin/lipoyl-binding protein [Archangium gephyra]|uniref:biotin/lipoyl-binding protein n=1 Tax=Archangium gephyra TaxID=48 RepID=UPI003B7A5E45